MKVPSIIGGTMLSLASLWGGSYFMAPEWFAFPLYLTCSLGFIIGAVIVIKGVEK
jgi:hypothetical protein